MGKMCIPMISGERGMIAVIPTGGGPNKYDLHTDEGWDQP